MASPVKGPEAATELLLGKQDGSNPQASRQAPRAPSASTARLTVELLLGLMIAILIVRLFVAEAYVVPTGSMAPTLLGRHRQVTCLGCGKSYVVGIDELGGSPRGICPRCGDRERSDTPSLVRGGDRVLVQKFVQDFRPARRWEVAVFRFPEDPTQAYVKRVVGLPGESVRIAEGDVHVNGRIARKTLEQFHAMRILVHEAGRWSGESTLTARWQPRGGASGALQTGWTMHGGQFLHEPSDRARGHDDWLVYHHWDPVKNRPGPVRDFYEYDGEEGRAENEVEDLALVARVELSAQVQRLSLRLRSHGSWFEIRLPVGKPGAAELFQDGRLQSAVTLHEPFPAGTTFPREVELEAAVVDRRVQVAVDGRLVLTPHDFESSNQDAPQADAPIALGVMGGEAAVRALEVYRDIYYTSYLTAAPIVARGVGEEVKLNAGEYFMLGDNSPVSCDSRFWNASPVVPSSLMLGKPFLVHLPGDLVPFEVLGRSICWVPDPRRIRYIQ